MITNKKLAVVIFLKFYFKSSNTAIIFIMHEKHYNEIIFQFTVHTASKNMRDWLAGSLKLASR
ncbi:hypothetical protein T07_1797 [Trichinella nelsoni]|uniref:Uncharacterized protein n=1 Tax=Trichinella nelsoni TaxID=6336 RepID=A0A0V0SGG4_9BILA|nr:hypothetical protein T07_1797 [Trichinella nelsoni]